MKNEIFDFFGLLVGEMNGYGLMVENVWNISFYCISAYFHGYAGKRIPNPTLSCGT